MDRRSHRERILDAAGELAQSGARVTMSGVAKRAGLARGTVYSVFPNVAALLAATRASGTEVVTTRGAILDSCGAILRREGPGALTLARVAAEAGVGEATLYRLFVDRGGLLRAWASERSPRRLVPDLDGRDGEDMVEDLATLLAEGIAFVRAYPGLVTSLPNHLEPELTGVMSLTRPGRGTSREALRRYLSARADEGKLAANDVQPTMKLLFGAVLTFGLDDDGGDPLVGARFIVRSVLHGVMQTEKD